MHRPHAPSAATALNSRPGRCFLVLAACTIACLATASPVAAGFITSPTAVLENTGGEFSNGYAITNAINGSGLSTGFTSGFTDFDAYLAGNPLHTNQSAFYEWFTPLNVTSSTVIFDLGVTGSINRIALWNEEGSGVASLVVQTSNDAAFGSFTAAGSFIPINNPDGSMYPAEVLALTASTGRYVRLFVTGPQANFTFNGIGLGEIAFDVGFAPAVGTDFPSVFGSNTPLVFGSDLPPVLGSDPPPVAAVPVPATALALAFGGGLLGVARRVRRRA